MTNFERFNRFMDEWYGKLSVTERGVWLLYLRHADADGVGFPGPRSIAERIGHSEAHHVRAARKKLAALGLLELIRTGDGHESAKYRVAIPSTIGTSPPQGLVHRRDTKWSTTGTSPSPPQGRPLVPGRDIELINEQTMELINEQTMPGCDPNECESIYRAYPRKVGKPEAMKAIARALKRIKSRRDNNSASWLMERTVAYAASRAGEEPKFTPYPQRWFNHNRFDDEIDTPAKSKHGAALVEGLAPPILDFSKQELCDA